MARLFFPLFLIALGAIGLAEHQTITNEWDAMYPRDAAEREALAHCAQESGTFNRFSAAGRAACYAKYLQVQLPASAPGLAVGIPRGPSHAVPHAPALRTTSPQR